MADIPGTVLLQGVVGSTAYGLARPGSDVDRLGLYAAPTEQFHALDKVEETITTTNPDSTVHEAAKWCRLALQCNPTVLELAWLPDELYEVHTPLGDELVDIRWAFLSAKRVRDAYLGYATQQFRKLERRGDGSFSADTRKRTEKHARHLGRLLEQGVGLYTTGRLRVQVRDPQALIGFGQRVAAGHLDEARDQLAAAEDIFDTAPCALPTEPDRATVGSWLRRVRRAHLTL